MYQLSVGEPLNYETDIGPIYDNQVVDRTLELINQCSKQNFKLLCGGGNYRKQYHVTNNID